ncbi:YncE family protein [Abyssalbus ytuae]|uniref:YncE family protein n=1 Tax=Abyssalbus ytuae TaxID=2926907 RepID=A0A9E6ZRE5_9FLAO|nr:YncE family protein [Abyssalbus ytuae]UOB19170.1 YncE family protein [Abyssalbus ytuae]
MKILQKIIYTFIISLFILSCSDDDNNNPEPLGDYVNGILISNEGPFNNGSGTVTFISEDYSLVESEIFKKVNDTDIGNVLQSIGFYDDKAYLISNNSHLIKVVNRFTFEEITTIDSGLENPRYFLAVGTKGYVTNWGDTADENDDYVAVINLNTNDIEKNIQVVLGPEKLEYNGNNIYVAHQGAYGQNNQISVIDPGTDEVSTTIEVGDVPNSLVVDGNDLWVLSGGSPSYTGEETNGSLKKINTTDNVVSTTLDFELAEHPDNLSLDGANLFYSLNGKIYKMSITDTELPVSGIIDGYFYRIVAKDGKLYATDAGDYASNGSLTVFDLSTNSEIKTVEVGIVPGGIYFNN